MRLEPTRPSTEYMPIVISSGTKRLVVFVRRCNNINFEVEFRSFTPIYPQWIGKGGTLEESMRNLMGRLIYHQSVNGSVV